VLWAFAIGSSGDGDATFGLARPTDPSFPDFTFPAAFASFAVALVLASLGGVQLARGFGNASNLVLGVVFLLVIFAFLAWATAQSSVGSFSLVGMLQGGGTGNGGSSSGFSTAWMRTVEPARAHYSLARMARDVGWQETWER